LGHKSARLLPLTGDRSIAGLHLKLVPRAGEDNHAFVRSLGAEPTTYGTGLVARVRAWAPAGVDAVFDCAGGALPDLVTIAGDPARVVTIADPTAAAHGVHMSHGAPPEQAKALGIPADPPASHGLAIAATLAGARRLRIPVAAAFPLDEVVAAATLSESRHAPGKVVLVN
jgi:hypothetical protein